MFWRVFRVVSSSWFIVFKKQKSLPAGRDFCFLNVLWPRSVAAGPQYVLVKSYLFFLTLVIPVEELRKEGL